MSESAVVQKTAPAGSFGGVPGSARANSDHGRRRLPRDIRETPIFISGTSRRPRPALPARQNPPAAVEIVIPGGEARFHGAT
jgi:hypothetical protein